MLDSIYKFILRFAGVGVIFLSVATNAEVEPPASSELDPIEISDSVPVSEGEVRAPSAQRLEIQADRIRSVGETLVRSSAVSFRKWGSDESSQMVSIRGQDPTQTRLYLNGFPLGESAGSGMDTRWLQPRWLSHLWVLPNGAPVALWQETLGGAVDLRSADVSKSEVGVTAGSFATRGAHGKVAGQLGRRLRFTLGADGRTAQENFSFRDSAGTLWDLSDDQWQVRANNGWWRASVFPTVDYEDNSFKVSSFWLGGWETRELPGPAGSIGSQKWREQLHLVGAKAGSVSEDWQLQAFGRHRSGLLENAQLTRPSTLAAVPGESRSTAGGVKGFFKQKVSSSVELQASASGEREDLQNQVFVGTGSLTTGTRQTFLAAAELRWLSWLETSFAFPVEWDQFSEFAGSVGYEGQAAKSYLLWNPRLSLSKRLSSGWNFRGAVGQFQRSPGLYDLYGDARGLAPNPKLMPERSMKTELGIDWTGKFLSGTVVLSTTASLSRSRELLVRVNNSPTSAMVTNIGNSRIFSQEFSAAWTHTSGVRLQGTVQTLSTRNFSSIAYYYDKFLPFRPSFRTTVDLEKEFSFGSVGYLWQYQSDFFADAANVKQVGAFQEHSLRARFHHRSFGNWLLELNNLFDVTSVDAKVLGAMVLETPSGFSGFPYPGRRVFLSWSYLW